MRGYNYPNQNNYPNQPHNYNNNRGTNTQTQSQKMIVDQNYANNIVFMGLSTVEEVIKKMGGLTGEKKFGRYDKVKYDQKNLQELKSQLQVHLMLIKSSKQCFFEEYSKTSYQLPNQFNE